MIDLNTFRTKLHEFDALRDGDQITVATTERIKPNYAPAWPDQLHPAVRDALISEGIVTPYEHQARAIEISLSGADVVLESPTASGKTLAFMAPMLSALKQNRKSHALMIYPMKALAFDQREQMRSLCGRLSLQCWPYDGDTPEEHRRALRRQPPDILLTNPEYLNMSFLAWKDNWTRFLRNLRFVVIDEMHEYRGFFGSNMALLLRRFLLCLRELGASPHIFLSTATCANPREHARNLTGRDVELISASHGFRPTRHFMFIRPDIPDFNYRDILRLRIEQAALAAHATGSQALIFCPTKRFLEEAYRNCRQKLKERGDQLEVASPFHADLPNDVRQQIQSNIRDGRTRIIFTTNALELGLDIGGLDVVILAGFPPSIMSAWQQIGRAGRGWDKDATVMFYAMNDPIDRFFVSNVPAFLDKPLDELIVDPDNETLIENHLPSLAQEMNGKLPPLAGTVLGQKFFTTADQNMDVPPPRFKPQVRLNLRGGIGQQFDLKLGNNTLGQISGMRRFRETYIGAVFTFFGKRYQVKSHEENAVVLVEPDSPHLRTDPKMFTLLNLDNIFDGLRFDGFDIYYGELTVTTTLTGYSIVDERRDEIVDHRGTSSSYSQRRLHGIWISLQDDDDADGIGALEHLFRVGAMFTIPADRFDTSTYSTIATPPMVYYYENYAGGIGVAKKLFTVWTTVLRKGVQVAESCSCQTGCQNCIEPAKSWNISNAQIDKVRGVELARELLEVHEAGPSGQFGGGRMEPL